MPGRIDRRIARILAFQALYSWDVGGVNIDDLLSFSWIENDSDEQSSISAPLTSEEEEENGATFTLLENQLNSFKKMDEAKKQEVYSFARILVKGTVENLTQIDSLIEQNLSSSWNMDRVNKVALAVIRMSVYALLFQKDLPSSVVIDEAVEIVKDYGVDDSHKFTNAILDKIKKDISVES